MFVLQLATMAHWLVVAGTCVMGTGVCWRKCVFVGCSWKCLGIPARLMITARLDF